MLSVYNMVITEAFNFKIHHLTENAIMLCNEQSKNILQGNNQILES